MNKLLKITGIGLGLIILWIAVAPLLAYLLIVEVQQDRADAIVVLSGSSVFKERTKKAAELFKLGRSDKILLTDDGYRGGWSPKVRINPLFVELARRELLSQGVPADAIVTLPGVVDGTDKEAAAFVDYAQKQNLRSATIVTSAYHTRRALWTFEKFARKNGIEFGIEHPAPGIQTPKAFSWWLKPAGWRMIAGEYVKFIGYYVYYWQV